MHELSDRLAALHDRIERSLVTIQRWIPRPAELAGPATIGVGAYDSAAHERVEQLERSLASANANTDLQAQRCVALEDRVAQLEASLVGAAQQLARAQATADDAKLALATAHDEIEGLRHSSGDGQMSAAVQAKFLEIEQLTRERDTLRRSSDEWRTRARKRKREHDELSEKYDRAQAQLLDLRARDEEARRKLSTLERTVAEQTRDLDMAQRRTQHLRARLNADATSR